MPDALWPLFQRNRHLLHDVPVLGAQVLQQWARQKYGIRLMIVVIPHTFGHHLNFNCHLHILVSEGGLKEDGTGWRTGSRFDREALMPMWRYAIITYLRAAARAGIVDTDMSRSVLLKLLTAQYERWWSIDIKRFRGKKQFLGYAGRYARRPPIAQHRFRKIDRQEIRFLTKDTRTQRAVETTYTPAKFLITLADHISDHYRHNIRYFGPLAPRVKGRTHDAVFALLGQERLGKPRRLLWAASLKKSFGVDPLQDSEGQRMRWSHRLPPTPLRLGEGGSRASEPRSPTLFDPPQSDSLPARGGLPCGLQSVRLRRFDPTPEQEFSDRYLSAACRPTVPDLSRSVSEMRF